MPASTNPSELQAVKARIEMWAVLIDANGVGDPDAKEAAADLRALLLSHSEMEGRVREPSRLENRVWLDVDDALTFTMRDDEIVSVKIGDLRKSRHTHSALTRRVERLKRALKLAATWFREYERGHLAKATEDGNDKASRNRERAEQLEAALNEDQDHG